jgi:hypothetical protein
MLNNIIMGTTLNPGADDNGECTSLQDLMGNARSDLYLGCTKLTKQDFILKLLHIKSMNN